MPQLLELIGGIPTIVNVITGGATYDNTAVLGSSTTAYTLPGGQTYTPGNVELLVWVDGVGKNTPDDYTETSTTQITFTTTLLTGQRVRVRR